MTPRSRDIFIRPRSATCLLGLIVLVVLLSTCRLTNAQYGGSGYSQHQDGSGAGGYESNGYDYSEVDERPKLKLGIRLRIPAFKFELPRFSLPKITVSAKIRQPEGPRVITLPEINLDTSSKVEPPNSGHVPASGPESGKSGANQYGGEYSTSASNYRKPSSSYGQTDQDSSQVFSFSTEEEKHAPAPSSNSYHSNANRYYSPATRPAQMNNYNRQYQHHQQQQPHAYRMNGNQASGQYGAPPSPSRAFYTSNTRMAGTGSGATYYQHVSGVRAPAQASTSTRYYYDPSAGKNNADLGFNSPVYVDPRAVASG